MPDLIVSFTADQVTRIKAVYNVSTAKELAAIVKKKIAADVFAVERAAGSQSGVDAAEATLNAEGWNE